MVVAIPIFGSEVSPRFDCAKEILLVNVEEGKIIDHKTVEIRQTNPLHRARILSVWKVQQLICGGIDDFSMRMLNGLGIQVFPWFSGEAQKVLENFLNQEKKYTE